MDNVIQRNNLKITEIIKSHKSQYSIEVTPDIDTINKLSVQPEFVSITWHAKSHKCQDLNIAPLRLAKQLSGEYNVMLHVSCDLLRIKYLNELLSFLVDSNVKNLFIVLGESYTADESDFKSTKDLIKYIRQKHKDYFCIGVAGYPEKTDIQHMEKVKEKLDAGADFVITQAFFDTQTYKDYRSALKKFGIDKPIVPGIFPFRNQKQLLNFSKMCKVKILQSLAILAAENPEKSLLELKSNFIKDVREISGFGLIHYFTLNNLSLPNE